MTGKGNKYYVVFRGRNPGIYYSWDECRAQVHGFKNNRHERYPTLEEAQQALQEYFANPDSMESPSSSHPWHHVDSEGISGGTPNLSQTSTSPFSPVQQNSQTSYVTPSSRFSLFHLFFSFFCWLRSWTRWPLLFFVQITKGSLTQCMERHKEAKVTKSSWSSAWKIAW